MPAAGGPGELAIYALDGARVRVLGEALGAGAHELGWDLRDDRGARVRSGVYFARLRQGRSSLVRRLVVVG